MNVVYQTSPILMDQILDYKFSYDKTESQKEKYNRIFNVDLLIIDDLGTETMNNNKFTELFNIINTRLLNNKKMPKKIKCLVTKYVDICENTLNELKKYL